MTDLRSTPPNTVKKPNKFAKYATSPNKFEKYRFVPVEHDPFGQQLASNWSDLPGNILPSAGKLASDIWQSVRHPMQTIEDMSDLVTGLNLKAEQALPGGKYLNAGAYLNPITGPGLFASKLNPAKEEQAVATADAMANFYRDRYGGWDRTKHTLISDPIGFLGDASAVLSGGETIAARLPAVASKLGRAAELTNPVRLAGKTAAHSAKSAAGFSRYPLSLSTGAGEAALGKALSDALDGGGAAETFRRNLRGHVSPDDLLKDADPALGNLAANRRAEYTANMQATGSSGATIDYAPINAKLDELESSFRAQPAHTEGNNSSAFAPLSSADPAEAKLLAEMRGLVDAWQQHPQGSHPLAADALKQRVSKMAPSFTDPNAGNLRRLTGGVADAIKQQIMAVEPSYAKAMEDYSEASDLQQQIQKSLSLGGNASKDIQLGKLQSIFAKGAETRNPARAKAVSDLEAAGAKHLTSALAGQQLRSVTPKGMAALIASGGGAAALWMNPWAIPGLVATSPRLMGEAMHGIGRGVRRANRVLDNRDALRAMLVAMLAGRQSEYAQ